MPTTSDRMRALVFDGPAPDTSRSRVTEMAVPDPGPGEVAVDVRYAGINFKDVMARRGDPGYVTQWPFVPGLEVAGTVRALGPGVDRVSVGERVTAFTDSGGLAEVALARAELTVGVPSGLGLERAAAAPAALTTAALLLTEFGRVRKGDILLVHSAAGAVGQALARLARLAGVTALLGTVGGASRIEPAQRAGYDAVYVRDAQLANAIKQRTSGHGVDLVLDPQGTQLLDLDLSVTATGARIVLFGNATGEPLAPLPPPAASSRRMPPSEASVSPPSPPNPPESWPRRYARCSNTWPRERSNWSSLSSMA